MTLRRTYKISRGHLPKMTEIIKEIDNLSPDYKVAAIIPVMAPHMDYLHGAYHFDSLAAVSYTHLTLPTKRIV